MEELDTPWSLYVGGFASLALFVWYVVTGMINLKRRGRKRRVTELATELGGKLASLLLRDSEAVAPGLFAEPLITFFKQDEIQPGQVMSIFKLEGSHYSLQAVEGFSIPPEIGMYT